MFMLCVVGLVTYWLVLHTKSICDARSGFRLKLGSPDTEVSVYCRLVHLAQCV